MILRVFLLRWSFLLSRSVLVGGDLSSDSSMFFLLSLYCSSVIESHNLCSLHTRYPTLASWWYQTSGRRGSRSVFEPRICSPWTKWIHRAWTLSRTDETSLRNPKTRMGIRLDPNDLDFEEKSNAAQSDLLLSFSNRRALWAYWTRCWHCCTARETEWLHWLSDYRSIPNPADREIRRIMYWWDRSSHSERFREAVTRYRWLLISPYLYFFPLPS